MTGRLTPGRVKLMVLLCASIPSFMINLDANIVAVSLPTIAQALHADFAAIEWVISAYMLSFASLVLPAGALADRYGRKRILIIGLGLFTVASLVCGAAPNATVLNFARAVQGAGAALQLSAALALLSREFQGADRARAFAFWGSVIGVAITFGPIAGGVLTQTLGWEWAFYINLPVGIAMIALTAYAVTETRDPHAERIDLAGFATFAGALSLLTFALISGNHRGWTSKLVLVPLAAAVLLFGIFLVVERRQTRPMLDLSFFRRPTYIGANVAGFAYASTLLTMLTYLPLYFQGGLALTPMRAGLYMLPIALPLFVVPRIVAAHLTHRYSGRFLLASGLGLVSLGLCAMAFAAPALHYAPMLIGMIVAGLGAGMLNGETAKVSMTVIPPERAGMAAGVGGTIRFAGILVGFASLGAVLYQRIHATLTASLPNASPARISQIGLDVVSGNLHQAAGGDDALLAIAHSSFGSAYQMVFAVAGIVSALAGFLSWRLVQSADTAPTDARSQALVD
jgi:EmrB/QacA subfamily drug resistance transporter